MQPQAERLGDLGLSWVIPETGPKTGVQYKSFIWEVITGIPGEQGSGPGKGGSQYKVL